MSGCVVLAVYGTGGSLAPPDLPDVPPERDMTARAVSASLALASVRGEPTSIFVRQRELVDLGLSIAEGNPECPPTRMARRRPMPSGRTRQ